MARTFKTMSKIFVAINAIVNVTKQNSLNLRVLEQYQYLENSIWCIIDLVYVPRHEP